MLARLAPIVVLLAAACSDDAGWSRDELPAKARVALMVTGTSADQCFLWAEASAFDVVEARGLDTDAPTVVVQSLPESCTWSGSELACPLQHGPVGSISFHFDRSVASQIFEYTDIGGTRQTCLIDYAITAVAAIP